MKKESGFLRYHSNRISHYPGCRPTLYTTVQHQKPPIYFNGNCNKYRDPNKTFG